MSETENPSLSMRCPITRDLSLLRRQLRDFATVAGLSPDRTDSLILAVHEAAGNVVEHAGAQGTVVTWAGALGVWVDVIDKAGTLSSEHLERAADSDSGPGYGMGLSVVAQLCDWVGVRQSGGQSRLRMLMRYDQSNEQAAPAPRHLDTAVGGE
jgi:anti-sigma regulatory factor (Ser/Thr protein kinase)